METKKVKIRYFRNERGFPVACLAFRINYQEKVMSYGVSTWNPHDKWERRVAREVAEGRCLRNPELFYYNVDKIKTADILKDLMLEMARDKNLNSRVRKTIPGMLERLISEAME